MAVTGYVFPMAPPLEYAWVQVIIVLDELYEIDIPTDEGIEVLGDAMKPHEEIDILGDEEIDILWHH